MGIVKTLAGLFMPGASGRSALVDVAGVFAPNAEASAVRADALARASLAQHGAERAGPGWFGAFVDGLNRLPRPAFALGTLGLFVFCMVSPEEFAVRVAALALVPEPMWWLLGGIVSFFFGAREMKASRDTRAPDLGALVSDYRAEVSKIRGEDSALVPLGVEALGGAGPGENLALAEWRAGQGGAT
jgi:hypothetical protein